MTVGQALFSFKGRMSRSDYWLKGVLPLLPVIMLQIVLMHGTDRARAIADVISLITLWPGLALDFKRLHDLDHSGWFLLILLIPIANISLALVLMFGRGTDGPNRFGNDPLEDTYGQAPSTPTPSVEGIPMARRRALAVAAPSRSPAQVRFPLLGVVLILAGVLLILLVGTGAFLTYRIVTARNDAENVTPASYLLSNYENLNFNDRAGGEHEGWLLLGQKGSPVIFLCHGYNSNKSELLSLGTVLRGRNHFTVYLFNFYGPKVKSNYSDLGVREAADLIAAVETVTQHPGVNRRRVGLFGVTTGGYAALAAAEQSNLVKAVVVDTAYDDPREMFEAQMDSLLGGSRRLSRILSRTGFRVLNSSGKAPHIREDLQKLGSMPKLFISGRDTPSLAAVTEDLWKSAPEPKRLLALEHSQPALTSRAEKEEYGNQVLTFFLQNLPLQAD